MNIEDIEEAKIIPVETQDITEVLDEEVIQEKAEENTQVDTSDFDVDSFDDKKDPDKKDPPMEDPKDPITLTPEAERKQGAASRLMKSSTLTMVYNLVAKRVGAIANPKNPGCLAFDQQDTADINILLEDTVKEENWTGFPTKWLLLIVVALIIVGKIFTWNKPAAKIETSTNTGLPEGDIRMLMSKYDETIKALTDQNKMLQDLLTKKITADPKPKPAHLYKNIDLNNVRFSDNGAIIDPSKAGLKGYTDQGKKMGTPSHEEKELYKRWKEYQEHLEVA